MSYLPVDVFVNMYAYRGGAFNLKKMYFHTLLLILVYHSPCCCKSVILIFFTDFAIISAPECVQVCSCSFKLSMCIVWLQRRISWPCYSACDTDTSRYHIWLIFICTLMCSILKHYKLSKCIKHYKLYGDFTNYRAYVIF